MLQCLVLSALLFSYAQSPPGRPGLDLLSAAKIGDVASAKALVSARADVNFADWRGFTPLMWASAAGHAGLVDYLLENGATPGARAKDGTTSLMLAAANGYNAIVRQLIARGADVAASRSGTTARMLAEARGHQDTAAVLQQAEVMGTRLIQAATEGQNVLVRQLLALGAPYNATNDQGVSALMIVARNGDLGTLQFLLSRGADGTARDLKGRTVFDWAQESPATGKYVVAFLQDRGLRAAAVEPRSAPDAAPVAASLRAIQALLAKVPQRADRAAHGQAVRAVTDLLELSRRWPAESPDDYRVNLAQDARLLESALDTGAVATVNAALIAIAEDLETKLEHCNASGGRLGGSVLVRVRTVHGGEEARSWQVLYMPKILEVSDTATPDLFPVLSSPTEETLVPGRYVMWARNPSTGQVGERTVVKVGEGRKDLVLDLPVPADQSR